MPKKSLINYIKALQQKGYDISAIRNFLHKYGYSDDEINESLDFNPTIRHEIHLSHTTVFIIVLVFVFFIGIFSFLYYKPLQETSKLLDLNLEPVATAAEPGQSISFIKELSNLGSAKRYDVIIKHEIIEPLTNKIITQKIETRAIETFGSTQTRILIPEEARAGDYILRTVVEYDDKKAVATLPIKVVKSAKIQTCFDGIKNQNENGIDCGGTCKPCQEQVLGCNDNNQCTSDLAENNACVNKPIIPCCGNNICEALEESCLADCPKAAESSFISSENLDETKELARTNPSKALQQCNAIEVPDLKDTCIGNVGEAQKDKSYCVKITNARIRDLCYSNIAKSSNDHSICQEISTDSRKDSCYMTFVLDNKDYSVCDRITNKHLRQSCESLRQLSEIGQQTSEAQQPE